MDKLLAKLSEQQAVLHKQQEAFKKSEDNGLYSLASGHPSSSNSVPITPANETFGSTGPTTRPASSATNEGHVNTDEVLRLKLELSLAQNKISRLEEMSQTRHVRNELGNVTAPLQPEFMTVPSTEQPTRFPVISNVGTLNRGPAAREPASSWGNYDDSRSDTSDALSATGFNRGRNIWGNGRGAAPNPFAPGQGGFPGPDAPPTAGWPGRGGNQGILDPTIPYNPSPADGFRNDRLSPDYDMTIRAPNRRLGRFDGRYGPPHVGNQPSHNNGFGYGESQYDHGNGNMSGPNQLPLGMGNYGSQHPAPIGTSLSPLASEFTSTSGGAPWKNEVREPSINQRSFFLLTQLLVCIACGY